MAHNRHEREHEIPGFVGLRAAACGGTRVAVLLRMSTKSKRRSVRRTKRDEPSKLPAADRRAIGEIMAGLLNAITFGALESSREAPSAGHAS